MIKPAQLLLACASFASLAACNSQSADGPPNSGLDQEALALLDRHVAAIGGEAPYQGLQNLRSQVNITEQGAIVRGDYRATRDGRMRIDVYYEGERFFSEGIDAKGAWQQAGEGAPVEAVDVGPAARLKRGIDLRFNSLASIARSAQSTRFLGIQERDGTAFESVEIVDQGGHSRTYLIEPESGIVTRMIEREALHPDADPTENNEEEIRLDFTETCGILGHTRTRTINMDTDEELQSSEIISVECNLDDVELDLARPEPS
jgi:hypothetical protein